MRMLAIARALLRELKLLLLDLGKDFLASES
jgi:ABC-type branched-subunit amino acid transport system ATPase component